MNTGYAIIPMKEYLELSAQVKKSENQVKIIKSKTAEMIKSLSKDTQQLLFNELESAGYIQFVSMIRKMLGE